MRVSNLCGFFFQLPAENFYLKIFKTLAMKNILPLVLIAA